MNRKWIFLVLAVCLTFPLAHARTELTLEDITSGTYRPQYQGRVTPMADGESYLQMNQEGTRITRHSFRTGAEEETVFDVSTARDCPFKTFDNYILSPDESRLLIQTETTPIYRRSFTAVYYLYSIKNNKVEPLSDGGPQQVPLFSPDGQQVAFVRENNLYLVKLLYGNSESAVTKDGRFGEVINGIPDWVNEEEFGYNRAFDFSADSKMLAYIRFDESQVPLFSFMCYQGLQPTRTEYMDYPGTYSYKYPLAGKKNAGVSVHAFDIKSRVTRQMDLPLEADGYIPRIRFTKDANTLAIMTLNRTQNRFDLYFADPRSTVCRLIVRDENACYFNDACLDNIVFYPDHFTFMSEKSGYNHLYWYSMTGSLKRQVTQGNYVVDQFLGWDERTNTFYYRSNEGSPLQTAIYKVDGKGKKTRLTQGEGVNQALFSTNLKYFLNTFSSLHTPPVVTINDQNGKVLKTLIDNQALKQKLAQLELPEKSLFRFTTSEGVELNGWMIKPLHFETSRKYPVILYQYSGPGSQEVMNRWQLDIDRNGISWGTYMATQGFLVVCVDGRGTGGRGSEFEKCTYLTLGVKEAKDQVETARYIGSLPYADASRIGIWGWSFGGYCTLMSMSEGSGVFKAGIAVAAVTDWRYYDTIYGERFMRTPKENAEGYQAASAFTRADKLQGKLLLIHGTADDNVHIQNCVEYAEHLVQLNKPFDMHVYTNRNHSIYGGNTRLHLYTKMAEFMKSNL
ncbi:MAG: S9 family peptidase [Bacteroidaceae bacterium]